VVTKINVNKPHEKTQLFTNKKTGGKIILATSHNMNVTQKLRYWLALTNKDDSVVRLLALAGPWGRMNLKLH